MEILEEEKVLLSDTIMVFCEYLKTYRKVFKENEKFNSNVIVSVALQAVNKIFLLENKLEMDIEINSNAYLYSELIKIDTEILRLIAERLVIYMNNSTTFIMDYKVISTNL